MLSLCAVCELRDYELFEGVEEQELDQLGKGSQPSVVSKRNYIFYPR